MKRVVATLSISYCKYNYCSYVRYLYHCTLSLTAIMVQYRTVGLLLYSAYEFSW